MSFDSGKSDMDGAMARAERSGDAEPTDGLTRREHDILAFERQWWKFAGSKEDAIRELFSMSATRYYQVLNVLVDSPQALAADPMLVKRLRRLRASRQKARAARRLGFDVTGGLAGSAGGATRPKAGGRLGMCCAGPEGHLPPSSSSSIQWAVLT